MATSTDGIHWTRSDQPVLSHGPEGSWSACAIMAPSVVEHPRDGFTMYFHGFDAEWPTFSVWAIGRAVLR